MNQTPSTEEISGELKKIYARRFADTAAYRNEIWKVLTRTFFTRWIRNSASVLDLGCGYGEFINNIDAREKCAMDLNPDAPAHLNPDVKFLQQDCSQLWDRPSNSLDVVFTSNFFEHLPDKNSLSRTLREVHRCLKPGGRLIALGPNINALHGRYWDFFDHHVALSDMSLTEAAEINGFAVEYATPRFLPYTTVNAFRYPMAFVRVYLALPILWKLFGHQFLVVARKIHHSVRDA